MIAVIFEVEPAEGRFDEYLDHAARLKPFLEKVPGFISVERFRSLSNQAGCSACPSGRMTRRSPAGAPTRCTAAAKPPAARAFSPATGCGWSA